jgi:hypothetical protein
MSRFSIQLDNVYVDKERVKTSKGKMSLDLAKLPAGVYQIVVSDDITTHNFSVVKIP